MRTELCVCMISFNFGHLCSYDILEESQCVYFGDLYHNKEAN